MPSKLRRRTRRSAIRGHRPGVQRWGKDARLRPGVSPSPAVPVAGMLRPKRPRPAHTLPLYLHFALGFKMMLQLDLPVGGLESNLYAVRSGWNLDDHYRRRYACRPTLKQSALDLPATTPRRSGNEGRHGRENVGSAPESGHFVVSYISNHLTATVDPKLPLT
jgi:hypothetical protein